MISMYGPAILIMFFLLFILVIILLVVFLRPRNRPEPNLFHLSHSSSTWDTNNGGTVNSSGSAHDNAGVQSKTDSSFVSPQDNINGDITPYQLGLLAGLAGSSGQQPPKQYVPTAPEMPLAVPVSTANMQRTSSDAHQMSVTYTTVFRTRIDQPWSITLSVQLDDSATNVQSYVALVHVCDSMTGLPNSDQPLWKSQTLNAIPVRECVNLCLTTDLLRVPEYVVIVLVDAETWHVVVSRALHVVTLDLPIVIDDHTVDMLAPDATIHAS